jgi:hypothetical protein
MAHAKPAAQPAAGRFLRAGFSLLELFLWPIWCDFSETLKTGKIFSLWLYSLVLTCTGLNWQGQIAGALAEGLAKEAKDERDDNDAPATGRAGIPANAD